MECFNGEVWAAEVADPTHSDRSGLFSGMTMLLVILSAIILGALLFKYILKRSVDRYAQNVRKKEDIIMLNGIDGMDIPDLPVNFGYKCGWYAVKSVDGQAVARTLGIARTRPCNWRIGIDKAYEGWTYITPPVNGWTLICSNEQLEHDKEDVRHNLEALSQEYGEAQFFATHRVVGWSSWGKAQKGHMTRYYAYLGERGENLDVSGEPTLVELSLNLINTMGPEAQQEGYFDREDITSPTEDVVMKIASEWSIDPSSLETRSDNTAGLGLLCKEK